jgi:nicotinate-nucleotide pyrophosphorylase (carboxylating)
MTQSRPATIEPNPELVQRNVEAALAEDVGSGDITAALIPEQARASARIITREDGVLCGRAWVDQVFAAVDPAIEVNWQARDGARISAGDSLFTLSGPARGLLTGERCALNFLQLLSGTATLCRGYADLVADTGVKLLDTRKTIPGLRFAQKYAVSCGGCYNHRIGLYDAFLIKENHISACGGITAAVTTARSCAPGKPVEVEVENLEELEQALAAACDRVMLDNFNLEQLAAAVALNGGRAELEASGNITTTTLRPVALTGVDFISIGALTKDCKALDLSMRLL